MDFFTLFEDNYLNEPLISEACMLNNMKIGVRLGVSFGLVILLMLVIIFASIYGFSKIGGYINEIVTDHFPRVKMAGDTLDKINIVARSSFGVLLTDNKPDSDKELERIAMAMQAIDENISKLNRDIGSAEGREIYADFIKAKQEYDPAISKFVSLLKEGNKEEAKRLRLVDIRKMQRQRYMPSIEKIIQYEDKLTKEAGQNAEKAKSKALTTAAVIAFVAVIMAFILGVLITRSIAGPLKMAADATARVATGDLTAKVATKGKDEIGSLMRSMQGMIENLKTMIITIKTSSQSVALASEQLSTNSGHMSEGLAEQSGRASLIATSSEEMSQTVVDIAKNASVISGSADETLIAAHEGEGVVSKTIAEVQDVAKTVSELSAIMVSLGNRSKQIGEIVGVIKDIADQTNLLALNAAIEAARAGEQGRGFAVVADEVRKLADRTGKATSEISVMIEAIRSEVDQALSSMEQASDKVKTGVDEASQAGVALNTIVGGIDGLKTMIHQIASATEEMSTVSETISKDIETIADVSKKTLANSGQIAESAADLARLSSKLEKVVEQFRV